MTAQVLSVGDPVDVFSEYIADRPLWQGRIIGETESCWLVRNVRRDDDAADKHSKADGMQVPLGQFSERRIQKAVQS